VAIKSDRWIRRQAMDHGMDFTIQARKTRSIACRRIQRSLLIATEVPFSFVLQFSLLILAEGCRFKGDWKPCTLASLDSSSYGSVLSLTILSRLSTITLLNPVSTIIQKLQPKDGGPDD